MPRSGPASSARPPTCVPDCQPDEADQPKPRRIYLGSYEAGTRNLIVPRQVWEAAGHDPSTANASCTSATP